MCEYGQVSECTHLMMGVVAHRGVFFFLFEMNTYAGSETSGDSGSD